MEMQMPHPRDPAAAASASSPARMTNAVPSGNGDRTGTHEVIGERTAFRATDVDGFMPLLSLSPKMRLIGKMIEDIADTDATTLILGESGVGKDIVARAIHATSTRRRGPFVKVNCAALPAELLESELFGHEKGAFTGAYHRKLGQFEYAHKGTIFLDEIGELPLALQAKLLHVLQDFAFCRIGGRDLIRIDTRVVASTNRDLAQALRHGQFRHDLFYRLNVVEIHVPPLRERRQEIPALATWFLERFNRQYGRQKVLDLELTELMTHDAWPGNVRELENMIQSLVVLSNDRPLREALRARRGAGPLTPPSREMAPTRPPSAVGLREIARWAAQEAERQALLEVLQQVHWNRAEAARILKVSYKTILNKISECRLTAELSNR
jgi:transcriptional regulator with GAF, ATPase, and Fis domain